ncbi:hypothetical protein PG987_007869 [Apiospora arundinis]
MAFTSATDLSLALAMGGTAVGAAERCVPFLSKNLTGMTISDGQDAFEDLQQEIQEARQSPYSSDDDMDWEVNPFADASTVAKPANPFEGAGAANKPVNPFLPSPEPAATCLPASMDIDEWSITDHNLAKKQRLALKRQQRCQGKSGNDGNNHNAGPKGASAKHIGGRAPEPRNCASARSNGGRANNNKYKSSGAANKPNGGGAVGFLGNHQVTKAPAAHQNHDGSGQETRRGGNHKNNNSRRRSQGNKNRNNQRH